jgi:hypothetical protein
LPTCVCCIFSFTAGASPGSVRRSKYNVSFFSSASVKQTGELKLDAPVRFPPLYAYGRIYVTTQDGRIICRKLTDDDSGAADWPQLGLTAAHNQLVPEAD